MPRRWSASGDWACPATKACRTSRASITSTATSASITRTTIFRTSCGATTAKSPLPNVVTPIGNAGGGYATQRVKYAGDLFAEEALAFVEQHRERPFFLYLALVVPHANNERSRALGDGQEVPDYGSTRTATGTVR